MIEHEYIKVDPGKYWTGDMELVLPIGRGSDDDPSNCLSVDKD